MLCHAPAAVFGAGTGTGPNPFSGRRMTGLSNVEERFNAFSWKAKWLLQDRLKENGIRYRKGLLPMRPYVVVDGNLYTGQNPQSSVKLATTLVRKAGSTS